MCWREQNSPGTAGQEYWLSATCSHESKYLKSPIALKRGTHMNLQKEVAVHSFSRQRRPSCGLSLGTGASNERTIRLRSASSTMHAIQHLRMSTAQAFASREQYCRLIF